MNKFLKYVSMACIALVMNACVQDLDVSPIDPHSSTSMNADAMFTKCYACLTLIGQSDPKGDSDVDYGDAGTSGFYRTIWYCNELCTDEAWWIWPDEDSKQLCQTNWNGDNSMMRMIYIRLLLNIKYCNHYIHNAPATTEEEKYRMAEVRFIRALHYFYLMDLYLYAPLFTTDDGEYPHFVPRHKIYAWLVDELNGVGTDPGVIMELPADRQSDYRVGKAAAQLLLARIYLNADVYNKLNKEWVAGQMWDEAYEAANTLITTNPQHKLFKGPAIDHGEGFVYSAYQQLFMGDNHRKAVMEESLFQLYQDGQYAQTYAGSLMMVAAPRMTGMVPWGTQNGWFAMRTSPTLVDKFITPAHIGRSQAENMKYDEYKMPAKLKDDRAILCSDGGNTSYTFKLTGRQNLDDKSFLFDCWVALKFTGVYSTDPQPAKSITRNPEFPETDIPYMRLAEAYMIKAEAAARKSNDWNNSETLDIINNVIRARANAEPLSNLDEDALLDEWSREFYWEGRRRMDLIRFGRFFGPDADNHDKGYHWEGRMGENDGDNFVSGTPEYMNWFPIPSDDKRANPNYKTDVEGAEDNEYRTRGGDGYLY